MSELAKVKAALEIAVAAINGQTREGQIEMAEAVTNSIVDRHHLMVQAGTGTGKSLAYLVPAIVSGKRTLIATATLALQRQLVDRDLPKIVPALEKYLGRDISYGIYKGVGNYVCLQKLNSEEPDPDTELVLELSSLGKDAQRLRAWIETPGVSGDRDEAPEVDRRVWAASSVSGRECVGADICNFGAQCFAANAKAKATQYAKLLGVRLGSVSTLDETGSPSPYPIMMATAKMDSGATQVDLGQQDVSVSVTIKWSIK